MFCFEQSVGKVLTGLDLIAQKFLSDNGKGTYTNPLIAADFSDTDVVWVGETYYLFSTTMFIFPGVAIL